MKKTLFLCILMYPFYVFCGSLDWYTEEDFNKIIKEEEIFLNKNKNEEPWLRDKYKSRLEGYKIARESYIKNKKKINEECLKYNGKTWKEFIHGYGFDVSLDVVIFNETQENNLDLCYGPGDPNFVDFKNPPKNWNKFMESMDFCMGIVSEYYSQNNDAEVINLSEEMFSYLTNASDRVRDLQDLYRCNLETQKKKKAMDSL